MFAYVDSSTAFGNTYAYAVSSVDGDEESARTEDGALVATLAEERETVAPTVLDARIVTDYGTAATIDTPDVIALQFSETMNASATTGVFRFIDPDGEIFEVDLGAVDGNGVVIHAVALTDGDVNGDGDANDAGEASSLLKITLDADPLKVGGPAVTGVNAEAQTPGTITDFDAAFDDSAGNQVDLAGSADVDIDNEL